MSEKATVPQNDPANVDNNDEARRGSIPDNTFFEDPVDGHPRGKSWEGKLNHMRIASGEIEAGTTAIHRIEEPEILIVSDGEVAFRTQAALEHGDETYPHDMPFRPHSMFGLPIGEDFELRVPPLTEQTPAVGEEASDLKYLRFYPQSPEQQRWVLSFFGRGGAHIIEPTINESFWDKQQPAS